ncbi:MAG TPA: DUF6807 family protein [Limnochordia bacterium]
MPLRLEERDGSIEVWQGGVRLFRYCTRAEASKPHCDLLALPADAGELAGTNLVLSRPHDHVWHYGLFFVPKLVDGINCWESELFRREGRTHGWGYSCGLLAEATEGPTVSFSDTVLWRSSEGEELLRERRSISICEPTGPAYTLEWRVRLEAVGQHRHLSSESRHGHYSGLSIRFVRSMANGRLLHPGGENPPPDSGVKGPWCDYTGYLDGSPRLGEPHEAGIALFDHPANRYASRFFTMNQPFGFIAANPTYYQVLTLRLDEPLELSWAVWVHAGRPERSAIESAYRQWVSDSGAAAAGGE